MRQDSIKEKQQRQQTIKVSLMFTLGQDGAIGTGIYYPSDNNYKSRHILWNNVFKALNIGNKGQSPLETLCSHMSLLPWKCFHVRCREGRTQVELSRLCSEETSQNLECSKWQEFSEFVSGEEGTAQSERTGDQQRIPSPWFRSRILCEETSPGQEMNHPKA